MENTAITTKNAKTKNDHEAENCGIQTIYLFYNDYSAQNF